jgi:hypothetical protein
MFVSKVWGFDNPCGPLVFGSSGWRANAIGRLTPAPGARVILVGTLGKETMAQDHNRVLGMMEPSTEPVATSDFIVPDRTKPHLFREDGDYRWPYGLLNYRAWEFEPGLLLNAIAPREGNPFGSAAAAGIVLLTTGEERRVLAHPHHEIALLRSKTNIPRASKCQTLNSRPSTSLPTHSTANGTTRSHPSASAHPAEYRLYKLFMESP